MLPHITPVYRTSRDKSGINFQSKKKSGFINEVGFPFYSMMAEMYRSRTYRRPLDRPPVLKTGRHTGDETFPRVVERILMTIPTSQESVNRTSGAIFTGEALYPEFRTMFSYPEHRSDIVHEKMADVQFQCAVVAEKLSRHGPLFPRQNVFPKQRTQGRSRTSVRRSDDLVDFPSKSALRPHPCETHQHPVPRQAFPVPRLRLPDFPSIPAAFPYLTPCVFKHNAHHIKHIIKTKICIRTYLFHYI